MEYVIILEKTEGGFHQRFPQVTADNPDDALTKVIYEINHGWTRGAGY